MPRCQNHHGTRIPSPALAQTCAAHGQRTYPFRRDYLQIIRDHILLRRLQTESPGCAAARQLSRYLGSNILCLAQDVRWLRGCEVGYSSMRRAAAGSGGIAAATGRGGGRAGRGEGPQLPAHCGCAQGGPAARRGTARVPAARPRASLGRARRGAAGPGQARPGCAPRAGPSQARKGGDLTENSHKDEEIQTQKDI